MKGEKQGSDLVEVQRRVVTQSTDGSQLHQGIILGAPHGFTVLVPEGVYAALARYTRKDLEI